MSSPSDIDLWTSDPKNYTDHPLNKNKANKWSHVSPADSQSGSSTEGCTEKPYQMI